MVDQQKVKLAVLSTCDSISLTDRDRYPLPNTAIAAAGGTDAYVYAAKEDKDIVFYQIQGGSSTVLGRFSRGKYHLSKMAE